MTKLIRVLPAVTSDGCGWYGALATRGYRLTRGGTDNRATYIVRKAGKVVATFAQDRQRYRRCVVSNSVADDFIASGLAINI